MPAVQVMGTPIPKGSLSGYARGGRVVMVEKVKDPGKWREKVTEAGRMLASQAAQFTGPVDVTVTFTLPRPKSVSPARRPWPCVKPDLDKLLRLVLDAMTVAGVWTDDALVVRATATKCYPDSPGGLDAPGAVIRIEDHACT